MANIGFGNTTEGPDQISFSLSGVNIVTFNQLAALKYTIAASGSQNIDLTSLNNLVCESFSLGHALTIMILPTGGSITLTPGASNGLDWFMGSTSAITITAGGCLAYSEPTAGPGTVVSGPHKVLTLTNNGGTTTTVTLAILGSTT